MSNKEAEKYAKLVKAMSAKPKISYKKEMENIIAGLREQQKTSGKQVSKNYEKTLDDMEASLKKEKRKLSKDWLKIAQQLQK